MHWGQGRELGGVGHRVQDMRAVVDLGHVVRSEAHFLKQVAAINKGLRPDKALGLGPWAQAPGIVPEAKSLSWDWGPWNCIGMAQFWKGRA